METVLAKSKEYEIAYVERDPVYKVQVVATEIVKKFIIDNGLILYGGTAIDFALRLHGDKIYPDDMLKAPDLDFYSPKNVEHAYQLADIIYYHGYREVRAINAQHMETMRVDVADNHFIADITYRPEVIFKTLPSLEYCGMKIIHPMFQRIDLHSSLAFPYDNVPREVVFERWQKDIKRFNLLDKYYPVAPPSDVMETRLFKAPKMLRKYVLTGFAAYAAMYKYYSEQMSAMGENISKDVHVSQLEIGDLMQFDTLDQTAEILHFNPAKAAVELGIETPRKYESYIHIIPERTEGPGLIIYSTRNKLVAHNSVHISGKKLRVANVQFLLKHFMSSYFMYKDSQPKRANTHLYRYTSLLSMIRSYEDAIVRKYSGEERCAIAKASPLFPTVYTYGNENRNLASEVAMNNMQVDLGLAEPLVVPRNYYPDRSIPNSRPHPPFEYSSSPFFMESGLEITL